MGIAPLPAGWDTTRRVLQGYSHALTTFPRTGAPAHPRWDHVSMDVTDRGLVTTATPLADGSRLISHLDLVEHRIVARAGDDDVVIGLGEGRSPLAVAEAIGRLAAHHGPSFEIDRERVHDTGGGGYDPAHGAAFLASAGAAVAAMRALNAGLEGEITGPHLWPHGFDVATEWYSERIVTYEGSPANAQIAMGWYPAENAYLYVNPWPFDDAFADQDLPDGARWHRAGWEGAKWDIAVEISVEDAAGFGRRVHAIAGGVVGFDS